MPRLIACPSCQKKLKIPDGLARGKADCPKCGAPIILSKLVPQDEPRQPSEEHAGGSWSLRKSLVAVGVAIAVTSLAGFFLVDWDGRQTATGNSTTVAQPPPNVQAPPAPAIVPPAPQKVLASNTLTFFEAKKLLLGKLKETPGSPEDIVKRGIELIKQATTEAGGEIDEEPRLLLEHAEIAISDDAASKVLVADAYLCKTLSRHPTNPGQRMERVRKTLLDGLSPQFSGRFKVTIDGKNGDETTTWVCAADFGGGGEYGNAIEAAFYNTLERNAQPVIERAAQEKRNARRAKEQQVVLRDGTSDFKRIMDMPERYEFGHFSFDGVFGSRSGNMKRLQRPSAGKAEWIQRPSSCNPKRASSSLISRVAPISPTAVTCRSGPSADYSTVSKRTRAHSPSCAKVTRVENPSSRTRSPGTHLNSSFPA